LHVAQPTRLERALGPASLVIYGLAYVAPITVLATYGVATNASGGRLEISYVLATMTMLVTALSFGVLAREFPDTGSVYTYGARALHPMVGFCAGWALVLDYLLIPVINLILIGVYGPALFPLVPGPIWMLALLGMTTALNLAGIKTTDRAATIILLLELICVASFCVVAIATPSLPNGPPRPPVNESAIVQGAGLLALSFLGFDAVTTLSEEAKDPKRDVPRAVVLTCLIAGFVFCGVCILAFRAYPVSHFDNPDIAGFVMAEAIGGRWLGTVVGIGFIVGGVASTLASQAGAARLLFGISRQTGFLPPLARIHPTRRIPDIAIIVVAVIGFSAFGLSFDDAVSFVNFGALASFLVVHIAVIGLFVRSRKERGQRTFVRHVLLPVVGIFLTMGLLWGLSSRAKIVGAIWLLVGLLIGRRRNVAVSANPEAKDDLDDAFR